MRLKVEKNERVEKRNHHALNYWKVVGNFLINVADLCASIVYMDYTFRPATPTDQHAIWGILQQAILRRKNDGSNQWQDGYPNPAVIQRDIDNQAGYVLTDGDTILGYCAILVNDEPAYTAIEGKWLTEGDFVVFHRVAIAADQLGKGLAKVLFKHIEDFARSRRIPSVKADTNFDNAAMLNLFDKLGYTYCGEVYFRGSARKAYEKVVIG